MIDEKVKRLYTLRHVLAFTCWHSRAGIHALALAFTRWQGNTVLIKGTHHIFVNDDGVGRTMVFDVVV
jgi:hypothetical protein